MATLPDVATTEAAPKTSRAGRNLPAAIAVGLSLGGLILGTVYSPYKWTFIVIVALAAAMGTSEIVKALRSLGAQPPMAPLLVGGAATVVAAYRYGSTELFLGLALTVLGCLLWRLADPAEGILRDFTASVFTATYVPFLIGFAALMTVPSDGADRITAFVSTVICSDVGGYAAGVLFGKHPMAPSVSPKKSWEGFAGSTLACALGGAVFFVTLFDQPAWQGVLFGLAVVASATLGDLGESMVKRDIGIKDMGTLLPGHGGLMDRLDSLLPTAPIAWLLLTAFVPLP
ncbi:MAG: phosphatidate cytidylyltransferase [Frankiales bacterium]|nr:phosphatidate cytidylyltransferase [Frankiales bacterium]